jgi:hypothetical protein
MAMGRFSTPAAVALALMAGCGTYSSSLRQAQRAVEQGEHDRALDILLSLEQDTHMLSLPERARYDYLRGMTDYRMGDAAEARHWLALAGALEHREPGTLPDEWKTRLSAALEDLNTRVYAGGLSSLWVARDAPGGNGNSLGMSAPPPSADRVDETEAPRVDTPGDASGGGSTDGLSQEPR